MSGSTFTWSGATSTAWAPSGNWMPAGPPSSGDTANINPGTPNILTLSATELNNDTINLLNGATLAFDNGATLDGSSTVNGIAGTIDVSGVFTDYGNIAVSSGQTLVVSMAPGATLISNGPNQNGPGTDIGINDGGAGEFNGGALYVLGGTLDNQEVHVNGGYTDVTSALESNDELSLDGGTLEIAQQTTVSPAQITFINADTSVSSVLKLDNPTLFDGDNNGVLYAFKAGDTIVIGQSVARVIYNLDTAINGGTLIAENAAGNPLFTAQLSGGDAPTFASGTFDLDGGTIAGSFQVVSASNGDVLISEPSSPGTTTPPSGPATWNWIGGTGSYDVGSNWTAISGTNAAGYPANGDSAIIRDGTVAVSGASLDLNSLSILGTLEAAVALTSGGSLEVNTGLVILGPSTLSLDATSAVDVGTSGSFIAGAVNIDSGASLIGNGLVSASAVIDNGQLISSDPADPSMSSGGTLEVAGIISGSGGITLASGSALLLDGAIDAGPSITFNAGSAEVLVLGSRPGADFTNAITGLASGDWLEFGQGITVTGASVLNGNTIDVDFTSGGTAGVYDLTNVSFAAGAGQSFIAGPGPIDGVSGIELTGSVTTPGTVTSPGTVTTPGTVTSPGTVTTPGTATTPVTVTTPGTVATPDPTTLAPITISGAVAAQTDIDVLPIAPLSGVTVSDQNVSQTETVTVSLSSAANGTLTNLSGGSYNATTGVYSVTGSAAAVTAAIDGLQFNPTFEQVSSGSVTTGFTIAVTDSLGQTATNNTASVATSRANAQQTQVYQVFEAELGRAPDAGGLSTWSQLLASGVPPATLQADLATSAEAQGDINNIYMQIFGRPVDASGLAVWDARLAATGSLASVRTGIADSGEAQNDIDAIYQRILGRPMDPNGLANWENQLAMGASMATVASDVAYSAESQSDINAMYQQVLGRPADSGGTVNLEAQYANGASQTTVRTELAFSVESQGDINAVYQRMLGRPVDSGGLANWETQLANGMTQTTVAFDIAHSAEAAADLSGAYQASYGSAPNQGALTTLEARLNAGVSLATVESSLTGPLIVDPVSGQAITDQSTLQPFGVMAVTDPNTGDTETATIVLTGAAGTTTDANGVLSGTGLTHTAAGTYTISGSSAAGLTAELDALVFTPTKGEVPVGQSVTTNMSISVNDTVATGTDTSTSITATAVGSPTNLNFIYGSQGSDTLTSAMGPSDFGENLNPLGNDVVTNFNIGQDILQLNAVLFANYAAVEAAMTNVNGSAVIHFNSSSEVTLQGINPSSLTAANFRFA